MLDKRISKVNLLRLRRENEDRKLVVTNGCFDVIHAGHVQFLSHTCMLGDKFVLGLNSDESVRALKGPNRPINNVEDRAMVLSAFYFIDFIYIFEEPTAIEFLKLVKPDIYTKAGDYSMNTLDDEEKFILEENESEIYFLDFMEGKSSTKIIKEMSK